MIINCEDCAVRDIACGDCVVTVVLSTPTGGLEVGPDERHALSALAAVGLLPRLRHQPVVSVPGDTIGASSRDAGLPRAASG